MISEAAPLPTVVESRVDKITRDVAAIKKYETTKFGVKKIIQLKSQAEADDVVRHAKSLLDLDASREAAVWRLHDELRARLKGSDANTRELLSDAIQKGLRESITEGSRESIAHSLQIVELLGLRSLLSEAGKRPLGIHRLVGYSQTYQREFLTAIQQLEKHLGIPRLYPNHRIGRRRAIAGGLATAAVAGAGAYGVFKAGEWVGQFNAMASEPPPKPPRFNVPKPTEAPRGVAAPPQPDVSLQSQSTGTLDRAIPASSPTVRPSPTAEVAPTRTAQPTPSTNGKEGDVRANRPESQKPAPTATETARKEVLTDLEKEIGNANLMEYFLGDLIKQLRENEIAKREADPAHAERVRPEAAYSDNLFIAVNGIDETAGRWAEFSDGNLWGRADIIQHYSINPHTWETTVVIIQRDMLSREVRDLGFPDNVTGLPINKINDANMATYHKMKDPEKYGDIEDSDTLMRRVLESATGWPVHGKMIANIDFFSGTVDHFDKHDQLVEGQDGLIDRLYPNGVPVMVTQHILDTEYPDGYGVKTVEFKPGMHMMNGHQLTEYSRSRHGTSDFDRSGRQFYVMTGILMGEIPTILNEAISGGTERLDTVISIFEDQQKIGNFGSTGFDVADVMRVVRDKIQEIKTRPDASQIFALLAKNSSEQLTRLATDRASMIKTVNFGRGSNGVVDYKGTETLCMAGADTEGKPSELGNYILTWAPMRDTVQRVAGF